MMRSLKGIPCKGDPLMLALKTGAGGEEGGNC